jgi:hypothetical protein
MIKTILYTPPGETEHTVRGLCQFINIERTEFWEKGRLRFINLPGKWGEQRLVSKAAVLPLRENVQFLRKCSGAQLWGAWWSAHPRQLLALVLLICQYWLPISEVCLIWQGSIPACGQREIRERRVGDWLVWLKECLCWSPSIGERERR